MKKKEEPTIKLILPLTSSIIIINRETIQERTDKITALSEIISEKDRNIDQYKKLVAEHEEALQVLEEKLEEQDEVFALHSENEKLKSENDRLRAATKEQIPGPQEYEKDYAHTEQLKQEMAVLAESLQKKKEENKKQMASVPSHFKHRKIMKTKQRVQKYLTVVVVVAFVTGRN